MTLQRDMIRTFRSRALLAFWRRSDASRLRADQVERVRKRLDALNAAQRPDDMNLPGFDFHKPRGRPVRYTVHISGPWCITFEWEGEDAVRVGYQQYH